MLHYRSDADTFSEAVVGLDVIVQLFDGHPSQRAAVVGFIHVQHHWGGGDRDRNRAVTRSADIAVIHRNKVFREMPVKNKKKLLLYHCNKPALLPWLRINV